MTLVKPPGEEVTVAVTELWKRLEEAGKEVAVRCQTSGSSMVRCVLPIPASWRKSAGLPTDELVNSKDPVLAETASGVHIPVDFYYPVPDVCGDLRCYSMVGNLVRAEKATTR
jgi:hypothetical protein